ncbi:MAG: aminopeptidase P family protein [Candidatus Brocadiae bacterium]|nr:aminopeptidase P family protein [Candidatus Brocadiia bacterium]
MNKPEEFALKLERVERYLADHDLDGVILARSDNFAWLGCGANNVVNSAQETGVGALVVRPGRVTLLASNIETERLVTEELSGLDIGDIELFPWHEPARREAIVVHLAEGSSFAADDASAGLPPLPDDFVRLRYELTEAEIERYRALGEDAARAMENAARAVEKGMTEPEVAALIADGCLKTGILPIVLLVAADERVRNWRHPIVKSAPVRQCVMMVTCGRRRGLVAALTRLVHMGEAPEGLKQRHRAVCAVDAAMIAATIPGARAGEVFAKAQEAYAENGFADEWLRHHQGGAIGYQAREYIAGPQSPQIIEPNQAFAWNPSVRGTKSEDTVLVGEQGFELLTAPSADWPVLTVQAGGKSIPRADILVK